jgi:hypothetical protein
MTAYNNPATREEKAEALRNEQRLKRGGDREPTTLHELSRLGQDEEGSGRFAPDRYVTGSQAATKYPRQDNASPWSGAGADPGLEPPIGIDVSAVDPVGEQFEIDRSISEQEIGGPVGASAIPRDQELKKSAPEAGSPPFGRAVAPTKVPPFAEVVETGAAIPPSQSVKRRRIK